MPGWETVPRPSVGVPTLAALVVAVFAITLSGPLIAYAAAPGLAIACWRNIFAAAVLAPVAVGTRRAELARLAGRSGRPVAIASLLAGLALAVHFATWVPSVKLTGVAAATALVATQPVWQGLIAIGQGRRLGGHERGGGGHAGQLRAGYPHPEVPGERDAGEQADYQGATARSAEFAAPGARRHRDEDGRGQRVAPP